MNTLQRPTVLSVGIVLTALLSCGMLLLLVLGGLFGLGVGGYALAQGEQAMPLGLVLGAGAFLLIGAAIYYGAVLLACAKAWNGSHGWTIALIVFSAIGLLNPGILSLPIHVLTIVGAAMALAQDPRRVART